VFAQAGPHGHPHAQPALRVYSEVNADIQMHHSDSTKTKPPGVPGGFAVVER